MSELLLSIIVAVAPFQRTRFRAVAALAFAGGAALHWYFLGDTTGLMYYGSAALVDACVLSVVVALPRRDTVVRLLGVACIVSMGLNAIGWGLWFTYTSPFVYNVAFVTLYIFVVFTMCAGVGDGRRTDANGIGRADVLLPARKKRSNFFTLVGRGQLR